MYKISIQWTASQTGGDPITDYKVYWDNAEGADFINIAETTFGQTTLIRLLTEDGSDAGKSYYFSVGALNSLGEGEKSEPLLVVAAT
jgi:hypothetical protein